MALTVGIGGMYYKISIRNPWCILPHIDEEARVYYTISRGNLGCLTPYTCGALGQGSPVPVPERTPMPQKVPSKAAEQSSKVLPIIPEFTNPQPLNVSRFFYNLVVV